MQILSEIEFFSSTKQDSQHTHHDLRATPFPMSLLNFNAIDYVVSHSEPRQFDMAHH